MPRFPRGLQFFRSDDLDETEEAVSTGPCIIYGWDMYHDTTGSVFVQFYDATVATVVVGTTAPDLTISIGANLHNRLSIPDGLVFHTACTVACVTGPTTSDSTGAGANEAIVNVFFLNSTRRQGG